MGIVDCIAEVGIEDYTEVEERHRDYTEAEEVAVDTLEVEVFVGSFVEVVEGLVVAEVVEGLVAVEVIEEGALVVKVDQMRKVSSFVAV